MFVGRVECGTILLWFYLVDRSAVFPYGTKSYSRDVLGFIFLGLTLVAFFTSLKQCRAPVLLNRQQTEEWKGWMQVSGFPSGLKLDYRFMSAAWAPVTMRGLLKAAARLVQSGAIHGLEFAYD